MKIKTIIFPLIMIFFFLTIIYAPKNESVISERIINNGAIPISSSDINVTFGTSAGSATNIGVDVVYNTSQASSTLFAKINLEAGQVYIIDSYISTNQILLFSDSDFTDEIESDTKSDSSSCIICFAPQNSGFYYIKFMTGSYSSTHIGIFKATQYSTSQLSAGITIGTKNSDWGKYGLIFFTVPSECGEAYGGDVMENYHDELLWRVIDLNSGIGYKLNEMVSSEEASLWDSIKSNPGKGYLVRVEIDSYDDYADIGYTFKIDFSYCSGGLDTSMIIMTIIVNGLIFGVPSAWIIIGIIILYRRDTFSKIRDNRDRRKMANVKNKEKVEDLKLSRKADKRLEELKKISALREKIVLIRSNMQHSNKTKIDSLKDLLKVEESIFGDKLFNWAAEFGFQIDGDELITNEENQEVFLETLEKEVGLFDQYERHVLKDFKRGSEYWKK